MEVRRIKSGLDQPCDLLTLQKFSNAKDKINISDLRMLKIGANLRTEREEKHDWHLCEMSARSFWDHLTSKSNTRYGNTIQPVVPVMCLLRARRSKIMAAIYSVSRLLKRFHVWFSATVQCIADVHGLDFLDGSLINWLSATLLWTAIWWVLVELPTSKLGQTGVARLSCACKTTEKEETT